MNILNSIFNIPILQIFEVKKKFFKPYRTLLKPLHLLPRHLHASHPNTPLKCILATPAPPAAPNPEPAAPAAKSEAPKKVAHINPKSFNPYLGLARVLRALDQPKEAQKYFEIVIKMAPDVRP